MSFPALRALRDHLPNEDIYLAVKQYLFDVYKNLEGITNIITIPNHVCLDNIFQITGQLKKYHFDSGILFTNSFHSALLFKLAGVKNLTGYSKDLRGFLLANKIQFPRGSRGKEKHHIYFYMDLAALFIKEKKGAATIIDKRYSDQLSVPDEEKDNARFVLKRMGINPASPLIGISPSAAYGTAKQWPAERFGQLIDRITAEIPNAQILLFGSAAEKEQIARVVDICNAYSKNRKTNLYNLAGVLKLGEAIAAVSLCNVFVSNDSGLMHVAYSLNVPLVAIFGPTRPHKTGPLLEYHPEAKILYHPPTCAPCNDRDCPIDHACMNAVSVDEVLEMVHSLWKIS
jgi:heptosyltransferase-2